MLAVRTAEGKERRTIQLSVWMSHALSWLLRLRSICLLCSRLPHLDPHKCRSCEWQSSDSATLSCGKSPYKSGKHLSLAVSFEVHSCKPKPCGNVSQTKSQVHPSTYLINPPCHAGLEISPALIACPDSPAQIAFDSGLASDGCRLEE